MDTIRFLRAATCPQHLIEQMAKNPKHRAANGELVDLSGRGPWACSREAFNSVRRAYRGAFILLNRPKPAQTGAATVPPTAPPAETVPAKMDPMDPMDGMDTTAAAAAPVEPTPASAETPGSAELRRDEPNTAPAPTEKPAKKQGKSKKKGK